MTYLSKSVSQEVRHTIMGGRNKLKFASPFFSSYHTIVQYRGVTSKEDSDLDDLFFSVDNKEHRKKVAQKHKSTDRFENYKLLCYF